MLSNLQGHVLLVAPSYGAKTWKLPGGYIEPGESVFHTLAREIDEELSLTIRDPRFVGLYQKVKDSNLNLIFAASVSDLVPKPDGVEILKCAFFPVKELPPDVSANAAAVIGKIARGETPFILVF